MRISNELLLPLTTITVTTTSNPVDMSWVLLGDVTVTIGGTSPTGTYKLQKTNDPTDQPTITPVWVDIASATSFSATGSTSIPIADCGYKAIRAVLTYTSGTVTASIRINTKGA